MKYKQQYENLKEITKLQEKMIEISKDKIKVLEDYIKVLKKGHNGQQK